MPRPSSTQCSIDCIQLWPSWFVSTVARGLSRSHWFVHARDQSTASRAFEVVQSAGSATSAPCKLRAPTAEAGLVEALIFRRGSGALDLKLARLDEKWTRKKTHTFNRRRHATRRLKSHTAVNSQLCSDEPRHFGHQVRKPSSPVAVNGRKVDTKKNSFLLRSRLRSMCKTPVMSRRCPGTSVDMISCIN